ncbi:hypothetical protein [Streptomyces sp. 8L]|uniref:hypothetical protein n=1 Tax=Streptomyces sp. 8L TaxID=2877242 RepID=UPI001CD6AC38|nr:hypothetical protein [Streptomyces sp. 8L]MCA1224197.1 hypothetical protein [Streptomyces sp. 8L]
MTTSVVAEALRRDAAVLLEEYRAGRWVPDPAEQELAELELCGVARHRAAGGCTSSHR